MYISDPSYAFRSIAAIVGFLSCRATANTRKVEIVFVYKVDRLTRSLADFANLVELFDANGVSFISVTQQFNTTASMGRLTLNVLLSFCPVRTGGHPGADQGQDRCFRGDILPGEQPPIMDRALFDAAQQELDAGHPMTPTHATRVSIRYRYYMSRPCLHREARTAKLGSVTRVPAADIEGSRRQVRPRPPQRPRRHGEPIGPSRGAIAQQIERIDYNVLLLCTGNSARSILAESIMRRDVPAGFAPSPPAASRRAR